MAWRDVLFIALLPFLVGTGFLLWPQAMFRFRFHVSGDGLTAEGERAYRRFGAFLILSGVGFAVWGLFFL
ncbi:hypothetical protein [Halegenticoccus soli]|uniref:hypothetical protein n=1 Tax=Halegenticoccus soli TaxID=1985678 RepID=UPI000C6E8CE3|nr:hypothetical protein [Halegenticoccus soli]